MCSLFVGDLSVCVSEPFLKELFSEFGFVQRVEIKKGKKPYKFLDHGYVDFADIHDGEAAIVGMNGRLIFGRKIRVGWADDDKNHKKQIRAEVAFSFISRQLDFVVYEQTIRELFSVYGSDVADVVIKQYLFDKVLCQQSGNGFVHLPLTPQGILSAKKAVDQLANTTIRDINFDCELSNKLIALINSNHYLNPPYTFQRNIMTGVDIYGKPCKCVPTPITLGFELPFITTQLLTHVMPPPGAVQQYERSQSHSSHDSSPRVAPAGYPPYSPQLSAPSPRSQAQRSQAPQSYNQMGHFSGEYSPPPQQHFDSPSQQGHMGMMQMPHPSEFPLHGRHHSYPFNPYHSNSPQGMPQLHLQHPQHAQRSPQGSHSSGSSYLGSHSSGSSPVAAQGAKHYNRSPHMSPHMSPYVSPHVLPHKMPPSPPMHWSSPRGMPVMNYARGLPQYSPPVHMSGQRRYKKPVLPVADHSPDQAVWKDTGLSPQWQYKPDKCQPVAGNQQQQTKVVQDSVTNVFTKTEQGYGAVSAGDVKLALKAEDQLLILGQQERLEKGLLTLTPDQYARHEKLLAQCDLTEAQQLSRDMYLYRKEMSELKTAPSAAKSGPSPVNLSLDSLGLGDLSLKTVGPPSVTRQSALSAQRNLAASAIPESRTDFDSHFFAPMTQEEEARLGDLVTTSSSSSDFDFFATALGTPTNFSAGNKQPSLLTKLDASFFGSTSTLDLNASLQRPLRKPSESSHFLESIFAKLPAEEPLQSHTEKTQPLEATGATGEVSEGDVGKQYELAE